LKEMEAKAALEYTELKEKSELEFTELKNTSETAYKELKDTSETAYNELKESSEKDFNELKNEKLGLETTLKSTEADFEKCQLQLYTFKKCAGVSDSSQLENLCQLSIENDLLKGQLSGKEDLVGNLTASKKKIDNLQHQLFASEITRRKLHNQICELKGNVRVFVRVRPELKGDSGPLAQIGFEADQRLVKIQNDDGKDFPFSFDHVFPPSTTQADIFPEIATLVQSALDGYNVCLFSYGQTGSGKTHTMQGTLSGDQRGIIPRSIEKILEESARLNGSGWDYTLEAAFLEVYNETIRDLLGDGAENQNMPIKLNEKGVPHVPGLTRHKIQSHSDITEVMNRAAKHRSVAKTKMNSRSSRSHSVFTLYLKGENTTENLVVEGTLNLCDLAGSERLSRSGVTGDRLKETQCINKSLSCLADIFQSLASKSSHVPYRNSKLTHILQQCFSDQGKSLMLANLSPTLDSANESLCSLRFAAKVNNCELGKPTKQVKYKRSLSGSDNSTTKKAKTGSRLSTSSTSSFRAKK